MVIKKYISTIFRGTYFILSTAALVVWFDVHHMRIDLGMLNYLTTWSNLLRRLLMGTYFLVGIREVKQNNKVQPCNPCPNCKLAVTMCMIIIGLLFAILPRPASIPWYNVALHFICPPMLILDFIFFDEKGSIKKYGPLIWMILPIAYVAAVLIKGSFGVVIPGTNSAYPYPILDPTSHGVGQQIYIYVAAIFFIFLLIGYLIFLLDWILGRKQSAAK